MEGSTVHVCIRERKSKKWECDVVRRESECEKNGAMLLQVVGVINVQEKGPRKGWFEFMKKNERMKVMIFFWLLLKCCYCLCEE